MKIRNYIVFASFMLLSSSIFAQTKEFRTIENNAFNVGEKLTFDVKYGFVTAGVAVMEIPKIRSIAKFIKNV